MPLPQALTAAELIQFQDAAVYRNVLQKLRSFGLRTAAAGGFLCFLSLIGLNYLFGSIPFLLIGLWLIVYGLAIFKFGIIPRAQPFDIAFIAILAANTLLLVYETIAFPAAPGQVARSTIGLPIQLIIWFCFPFMYKRSIKQVPARPEQATLDQLDQMVRAIQRDKPEDKPDRIAFVLEQYPSKRRYKASLNLESGIFVEVRGREVSLFLKRDVVIEASKPSFGRSKQLQATFQFGHEKAAGTIDPASFEKYQRWKNGDMELERPTPT